MLGAIDELADWKLDAPGSPRITPRGGTAAHNLEVPFDVFWNGYTSADDRKTWRRSTAAVMAATLRLIVRHHLLRKRS